MKKLFDAETLGNLRMLASVTPPAQSQSRVDPMRIAESMARAGYLFDAASAAAVEDVCAGYGVCLAGDVGRGKTFFFKCLNLPILNLKLAQGRTLPDLTRALDSYAASAVVVDDIGMEKAAYKSYGTSVGLVDYIIEKRMEAAAPTHVTTNLTPDQLLKQYGARLVDRLTQLCHWHTLTGPSYRSVYNRRPLAAYPDGWLGRTWHACDGKCLYYDAQERRCLKNRQHEPRTDTAGRPVCPYID